MERTEQTVTSEAPVEEEAPFSRETIAQLYPEPERVLTCPGLGNHIRWQTGERLDGLIAWRCAMMSRSGAADRLAVSAEDGHLGYADLDRTANRLARLLLKRGVAPGDRVGLLFARSIWTYVAMLAVMKAGAAYVPLDPGFPRERVSFISQDAGIGLFLTTSGLVGQLDGLGMETLCLDRIAPLVEREPDAPLERPADAPPDALCYIIYTSGSTGYPKGVAVEHSSICNFVRVAAEVYGLTEDDRVYQGMTIAFDFSVEEIWVPLYSGSALFPAPAGPSLVGADLSQFLSVRRITALCCVPTLLATLEDDLPSLRFILVSGEACPHNLIERWYREGRTFLNVYGPTEATVTASWTLLEPNRPVTIGVPLPTYMILILEPGEARLARKGDAGEVCIAGIGLAREYVNRPDLTAKAFIPDFLYLPDNPSGRIYRTGDLGRVTGDGEIEYLGRIDAQVKIRGYRIELAEIESVIMRVPGIAQAVVGKYEPAPGAAELVAYYTLRQDTADPGPDAIFQAIRSHLPAYMLPAFYEAMDALPMLPSDKVDRKKLPAPSRPRFVARSARYVAPGNDTEREIARILGDVLTVEQVSMDDHFFDDLGANSLLMARFCARVRERFDFSEVSMREVYLHPTLRELTAFLSTKVRRKQEAVRDEPVHVASTADYVLCGFLQLAFYAVYSTALVVALVEGYGWVSASDTLADSYVRSAAFAATAFVTLAALPVALKWLLVGRWREERIPIWSLGYFRFWIVKRLVQANPMVLFVGSPVYNAYLRMLGAKVGRDAVIFSVAPVCTDLLTIGDAAIVRKDSLLTGYRARSGFIETGSVAIGRNAFVGEGTVLDIGTSIGDGAQLGHSSSLHRGQAIPPGKRYHGSPAQETQDDYATVEPRRCGTLRRWAFSVAQVVSLFAVTLPLPVMVLDALLSSLEFGTAAEVVAHASASFTALDFHLDLLAWSAGLFFGLLILGLAIIVTVPRLLNLCLREDTTYVLYGFHYFVYRLASRMSNSYFYNLLFGDSSCIIYYLRAIGYRISLSDQTGSNFGVSQKHDTPFLCEIGKGTLISDGISMINAHVSNTSFRLSRVAIGSNSFIGNNVLYPAGAKVGENCLLATKVMVPIGGAELNGAGLLGSPCFRIPRSVARDQQFEHYRDGPTFKERLRLKNISNTITMGLFLAQQWLFVHLVTLLAVNEMAQYHEAGWVALFDFTLILPVMTVAYFALVERASLGFGKLKPQFCSIYDDYYWKHERHWKLSEILYLEVFSGTPFKSMIWRLLGLKVGRKLFDDGCAIPEKSLVAIGDNCTINRMTTIQGHSLEDGAFKSDHIRIGNGCTIGCNAFVHYGVDMADGVVLDPDSFLMKGETLAANSTWRGNPAREI
ncbi:amino acid adenylation domain-containing protein (plasmid) [Skermanella mucosa]|uniref:Pls/PosA family non-ribosomal peptide synthetase n=1 Tax=Skermanella mucosa TaxID=1789672 RepID=UPI00192C76B8|nr:Pls/PosA family non-ribosomal peptide synthetase [Skermanella mucosa]UEM24898.1 amino acid adenylation domain-containing protein [Skermanella mucosa]